MCVENWVTIVAPSLQCLRCKDIGKFIFFWLCIVSFVKKKRWWYWKKIQIFSWSILLGDLPKWKTWKCFQQWFSEIHESDFNKKKFFDYHDDKMRGNSQVVSLFQATCPSEKHESVFNNGLVKYMKVISTIFFFLLPRW